MTEPDTQDSVSMDIQDGVLALPDFFIVGAPTYGANGAAAATTVTMLFVQSLLWWKAVSLTGIRADLLASHGLVKRVVSIAGKAG